MQSCILCSPKKLPKAFMPTAQPKVEQRSSSPIIKEAARESRPVSDNIVRHFKVPVFQCGNTTPKAQSGLSSESSLGAGKEAKQAGETKQKPGKGSGALHQGGVLMVKETPKVDRAAAEASRPAKQGRQKKSKQANAPKEKAEDHPKQRNYIVPQPHAWQALEEKNRKRRGRRRLKPGPDVEKLAHNYVGFTFAGAKSRNGRVVKTPPPKAKRQAQPSSGAKVRSFHLVLTFCCVTIEV